MSEEQEALDRVLDEPIEGEPVDQPPLIPPRTCAECGELEGSPWWKPGRCHV